MSFDYLSTDFALPDDYAGWENLAPARQAQFSATIGGKVFLDATNSKFAGALPVSYLTNDGDTVKVPTNVMVRILSPILRAAPDELADIPASSSGITPSALSRIEGILLDGGFGFSRYDTVKELTQAIRDVLRRSPELSVHAGLELGKDDFFKVRSVQDSGLLTPLMWRNPTTAGTAGITIESLIEPETNSLAALGVYHELVGDLGSYNSGRYKSAMLALLTAAGGTAAGGFSEAVHIVGDFIYRSNPPIAGLGATTNTVAAAVAAVKFRQNVLSGQASYVITCFNDLLKSLPNLHGIVGGDASAAAGSSYAYDLAMQLMLSFVPHLKDKAKYTVADLQTLDTELGVAHRLAASRNSLWLTLSGSERVAQTIQARAASAEAAAALPKTAKANRAVVGANPTNAPFSALCDSNAVAVRDRLDAAKCAGPLAFSPPVAGEAGFGIPGAELILREGRSGVLALVKHFTIAGQREEALRIVFASGEAVLVQFVLGGMQLPGETWQYLDLARMARKEYLIACLVPKEDHRFIASRQVGLSDDVTKYIFGGDWSLEKLDFHKLLTLPLLAAKYPGAHALPTVIAPREQPFHECIRLEMLGYLERITLALGCERGHSDNPAVLLRKAFDWFGTRPEPLRDYLKADLIRYVEQVFVDFGLVWQLFVAGGPHHQIPDGVAAKAVCRSLDTALRKKATEFEDFMGSGMPRHLLGVFQAQAAALAASPKTAAPPAAGGPTAKGTKRKARAEAPAAPAASAAAAGPRALTLAPARSSSYVPGSLASTNVSVNGDELKMTLPPRAAGAGFRGTLSALPERHLKISISDFAQKAGSTPGACCWPVTLMHALGNLNGDGASARRYCPHAGDPQHGVMGVGMHAVPPGLTGDLARSFR
jgi:hypothetical protein